MALEDEEAGQDFLKLALAEWEPQLCWLEIDPRFHNLGGSKQYKDAVDLFKLKVDDGSSRHRFLTSIDLDTWTTPESAICLRSSGLSLIAPKR